MQHTGFDLRLNRIARARRLRIDRRSTYWARRHSDSGSVFPGPARSIPVLEGGDGPKKPPTGYVWIQDSKGNYWEMPETDLREALQPYPTLKSIHTGA